jgi:hypothetical protein
LIEQVTKDERGFAGSIFPILSFLFQKRKEQGRSLRFAKKQTTKSERQSRKNFDDVQESIQAVAIRKL